VLQRAVAEARANRNTVDVVETNAPKWNRCTAKTSCSRSSPTAPRPISLRRPCALTASGWEPLNVFAQAYNTKAVKKEELPKMLGRSARPKWKGKLGSSRKDSDWPRRPVRRNRRGQGHEAFFKEIVAKKRDIGAQGATLLTQLVVSGEVPLSADRIQLQGEQFKGKGAPIDWFFHRYSDSRGRTEWAVARTRLRIRTLAVCSSTTSRSARRPEDPRAAATSCRRTEKSITPVTRH